MPDTKFDTIEERKEKINSLHIDDPIPGNTDKSIPHINGYDNNGYNSNEPTVSTKM